MNEQVVLSLKALSVSATVAASFDREKWRAQLEPIIDMWSKLTAAGAPRSRFDLACLLACLLAVVMCNGQYINQIGYADARLGR